MSTAIEWTHREGTIGVTWNPTTGCDRVSPGCDHCYALTLAKRLKGMGARKYQADGDPRTSGPGFGLTVHPDTLDAPLRWREPRTVFVNSMSDLFHDSVPDEFIADVWHTMAETPQHTYQILTKRHARMRSWVKKWCSHPDWTTPLPNVWLGVSVEDQKWADIRVPALLKTLAAVRFLSCEPLLGPPDLSWVAGINALECDWVGGPSGGSGAPHPLVDWVIVGGESGPGARPMHPDWARSLRDQCSAGGVPFFFKQWGDWKPAPSNYGPDVPDRARRATQLVFRDDRDVDGQIMLRAGKHRAGRELDGRTWDEYPAVSS